MCHVYYGGRGVSEVEKIDSDGWKRVNAPNLKALISWVERQRHSEQEEESASSPFLSRLLFHLMQSSNKSVWRSSSFLKSKKKKDHKPCKTNEVLDK